MNYELFASMTIEEAQSHLDGFRNAENNALDRMDLPFELNYSMETLASILWWFCGQVTPIFRPIPESEPEWIRASHPKGVVDYSQHSRVLILRASFYLGDCFTRNYSSLKWAIGNPETMHKNMPVVVGFDHDMQMPVMVVIKNIFSRIQTSDKSIREIEKMLESWKNNVVR